MVPRVNTPVPLGAVKFLRSSRRSHRPAIRYGHSSGSVTSRQRRSSFALRDVLEARGDEHEGRFPVRKAPTGMSRMLMKAVPTRRRRRRPERTATRDREGLWPSLWLGIWLDMLRCFDPFRKLKAREDHFARLLHELGRRLFGCGRRHGAPPRRKAPTSCRARSSAIPIKSRPARASPPRPGAPTTPPTEHLHHPAAALYLVVGALLHVVRAQALPMRGWESQVGERVGLGLLGRGSLGAAIA